MSNKTRQLSRKIAQHCKNVKCRFSFCYTEILMRKIDFYEFFFLQVISCVKRNAYQLSSKSKHLYWATFIHDVVFSHICVTEYVLHKNFDLKSWFAYYFIIFACFLHVKKKYHKSIFSRQENSKWQANNIPPPLQHSGTYDIFFCSV